jgi:ABC-type transporter Mla subunit MlaD
LIDQFRESVQPIVGKASDDAELFREANNITSLKEQVASLKAELEKTREEVSRYFSIGESLLSSTNRMLGASVLGLNACLMSKRLSSRRSNLRYHAGSR